MDEQLAQFLRALSTLFGWSYVLCWSLSFYPQPILNWKRKSTHGLTADFPALNLFGFISYTISTSCFLYSPLIRSQYAARHPSAPIPTVRFNDVAFAVHALFLVSLTYSQLFPKIWHFEVPRTQRTSTPVRLLILGSTITVILSIIRAASNDPLTHDHHHQQQQQQQRQTSPEPHHDPTILPSWTWINTIYLFSTLKILATLTKYTPQVLLNHRRKSTSGWSIHQILLDLAGGILSLAQLLIDASFQSDWSGVTGNLAKLGLSNISMAFDVVFIVQHYVLYSGNSGEEGHGNGMERGVKGGEEGEDHDDDTRPLLGGGATADVETR